MLRGVPHLGEDDDTKIAEQQLTVVSKQDVFRLESAVDAMLIMGVLQRCRYLLDVLDHCRERQTRACRVALAQGAAWNVVHHQIGGIGAGLHARVEHTYYVGMHQLRQRARLLLESCYLFLLDNTGVEQLDSSFCA